MTQQLRVTREVDFTGARQIGVGSQHVFGAANVFYVNGESSYGPTASDDYAGTNPDYPLATITQALSLCTSRANDYIFVMGMYQTDTFPLEPAARNVHLIGLGDACRSPWRCRCLLDGDDEAAFKFDTAGSGLELAGFRLGSSDAGDPCITVNTDFWFPYIHDCTFGVYMPATDGIYAGSGQHLPGWAIENCIFGTALTGDCIDATDGHQVYIKDCIFMEYSGIGIVLDNIQGGMILDNRFLMTAGFDEGDAIYLGAGTADILVDGNRAAEDGDEPGSNPYHDHSGASVGALANGWGLNYNGVTALEPGPND